MPQERVSASLGRLLRVLIQTTAPLCLRISNLFRTSNFGLRTSNYALVPQLPLSPLQSLAPIPLAAAPAPLCPRATFPSCPGD